MREGCQWTQGRDAMPPTALTCIITVWFQFAKAPLPQVVHNNMDGATDPGLKCGSTWVEVLCVCECVCVRVTGTFWNLRCDRTCIAAQNTAPHRARWPAWQSTMVFPGFPSAFSFMTTPRNAKSMSGSTKVPWAFGLVSAGWMVALQEQLSKGRRKTSTNSQLLVNVLAMQFSQSGLGLGDIFRLHWLLTYSPPYRRCPLCRKTIDVDRPVQASCRANESSVRASQCQYAEQSDSFILDTLVRTTCLASKAMPPACRVVRGGTSSTWACRPTKTFHVGDVGRTRNSQALPALFTGTYCSRALAWRRPVLSVDSCITIRCVCPGSAKLRRLQPASVLTDVDSKLSKLIRQRGESQVWCAFMHRYPSGSGRV